MSPERKTRVLTLVPPDGSICRLAPFMSRSQMEVVEVRSGSEALDLIAQRRFDLTTATLPLPDMSVSRLVTELRSSDRPLPLILMARGPQLEAARAFQNSSVRVVGLDEDDTRLRRAISESLGVASRLAVRIPIRLEVGIEAERFHRFCETRNISSSGLLISTSRPLPVGMKFNFELTLPYTLGPITGIARVVRHTDPDHEGTTGFGSCFVSLNDGDEARIKSFIQSQMPRS